MENKIVMEFPQENDTDLYLNVFGHSITEPLHKAGPAVKTSTSYISCWRERATSM